MALPIRDINPPRTYPYVTKALVFINIAVFIYELVNPDIILQYSLIPAYAWDQPYRWVTHMFLHGGLLHIVGNMIYLWVFGDNVEDHYGHLRFLVLYLMWGFAAAFVQYQITAWQTAAMAAVGPFNNPMYTPMLGASGAISGVLGAYMILYPRATIVTLVFFFVITIVDIPAWVYIGFWFLYQLFYGAVDLFTLQPSGVAYFAHIGGFLAGVLTAMIYRRKQKIYYWYWYST
ncbi:rhomboid family intramembrane serine protease [Pyrobaculum arsenaticum]|uniref:Rhomboid family protein n=2 Tax=Pyrobaculum arsenaticum TaxID=121277 RepID=A4WHL3_PYRAR|nr:rhomboid family intramembrane serine protease [Pyrobaculum arsenaticum]ABP49880.1 Rhomboid family protein [Pyrobaculum arsenaticum DSM 13514]NYR15867.1 rhomboid family intramembrane serine protease [Pyrobaculum arsenaticum]